MLLILIRGSPPLGLLELSRFPWVPHPRGPHHSFRNPSLTLLAHLLQRTTKPACGPPLQAPRNHNKIWRAVGKDVQSQLRHKDSSPLCTLNRDLWFEFGWHLIIVSHPSLCGRWIGIGFRHLHWLVRGIITSVVGAFFGYVWCHNFGRGAC